MVKKYLLLLFALIVHAQLIKCEEIEQEVSINDDRIKRIFEIIPSSFTD